MSTNIFQKSFSLLDEAIKTATQIRKSSIIFQDESGQWKIVFANERPDFFNDLESLNIPDNDCFIYINDNNGIIKRNKVQLTLDDTKFLAKCFTSFNNYENPLANQSQDLVQHLKMLMESGIEEDTPQEQILNAEDFQSGIFELEPLEFYCYFKKLYPLKLVVEIDTGDNNSEVKNFIINLGINNKNNLESMEAVFRKSSYDINEIIEKFQREGNLEIKLQLKEKILLMVKNQIIELQDLNAAMRMLNPLGKGILNNLSNYDLLEINNL